MVKFAASLLACLAIAGCGGAASADEPAGTPVTQDPAAASGVPFERNPNLVDPRAVEVVAWTPRPDGIAVGFMNGPQACFGADATVHETPDAVTVEVRTGMLPEAVGRACTMNLVYATLNLALDTPVGDREVRSAS